jgi:late competence protein required for DNA uptake (superfamily II DNA/RNA helicase)
LEESESNIKYKINLDNDDIDSCEYECNICMNTDTEEYSKTKCGHIFCAECIKNCLQYKKMCPMCKKPIDLQDVYLVNKKEMAFKSWKQKNPPND